MELIKNVDPFNKFINKRGTSNRSASFIYYTFMM